MRTGAPAARRCCSTFCSRARCRGLGSMPIAQTLHRGGGPKSRSNTASDDALIYLCGSYNLRIWTPIFSPASTKKLSTSAQISRADESGVVGSGAVAAVEPQAARHAAAHRRTIDISCASARRADKTQKFGVGVRKGNTDIQVAAAGTQVDLTRKPQAAATLRKYADCLKYLVYFLSTDNARVGTRRAV
eukprot:scaffold616_cov89-Phaeocystis_antarctica.AAC.4